MMHTITIVKRSSDFMAYLDDDKAMWGCGKNRREAIGCLIDAWSDKVDIHLIEESKPNPIIVVDLTLDEDGAKP